MKLMEFIRRWQESFGTKLFVLITAIIVVAYIAFSVFFVRHQSKELKNHLYYEGSHLTGLVAHGARLGVFAENREMLDHEIEAILEYEEARVIQVFNDEGMELAFMGRDDLSAFELAGRSAAVEAIKSIKVKGAGFFNDIEGVIEFWAPVTTEYSGDEEDILLVEGEFERGTDKVIGIVRIVLSSHVLDAGLREVVKDSIIIPVLFLVIGWIASFFIVKGILRPMKRLTSGVKELETTGSYEEVMVETRDEVGQLTTAFNDMAESLKIREHEKKELEEKLLHAQKMEAIGTFSGGVAHDFNNILSVIKGYSQMLQKRGIEGESETRFLEQIMSAAEKGSALTRSLLAFSRKKRIQPRPEKVNSIVSSMQSMLKELVGEDIMIRMELADSDHAICVDRAHLEHVLVNLATNARDAMAEGGDLTISTGISDAPGKDAMSSEDGSPGYALISVKDNGSGIDKETREKIFDPFFTTKDVGKGTGLGLALAYGIVDQHDGRIGVESEPGKGTVFNIYLPLTDAVVVADNEEALKEVKGGNETILVAEDDEEVRTLVVQVLTDKGYRVIEAENGEEAVLKFSESGKEIDLFLLDVMMPFKSGPEVCIEIRRTVPDIKVLFVSGYAGKALNDEAEMYGEGFCLKEGENLMYKPLDYDELLRTVRDMLDS